MTDEEITFVNDTEETIEETVAEEVATFNPEVGWPAYDDR